MAGAHRSRALPLGRLDHIDHESEHLAENFTSREAQTESARILLLRLLREGRIFCEAAKDRTVIPIRFSVVP